MIVESKRIDDCDCFAPDMLSNDEHGTGELRQQTCQNDDL